MAYQQLFTLYRFINDKNSEGGHTRLVELSHLLCDLGRSIKYIWVTACRNVTALLVEVLSVVVDNESCFFGRVHSYLV